MRCKRLVALCACFAVIAVGCGDDGGDSATGGENGLAALTLEDANNATGDVTLCIGKDTTGALKESIQKFNAQGGAQVKLLELPEAADEQRVQQVQRLRAESDECDVLGIDPIYLAEYANQGWLRDVTPVVDAIRADYLAPPLESANYNDKYWGLPYVTNAGFMYYRTDQANEAPATWDDLYTAAKADNGFVYQGFRYEGLTVNFLELFYAAGGEVLSEDGREPTVDSDAGRRALELMMRGIDDGAAPKAVTTYKEEESRRAFEAGNATFMRNWPYAYTLGQKAPAIRGKFAVAPLPGFDGNPGVSVLGGYNLGISAYSKNPNGSLAFMKYMVDPEGQKIAALTSQAPVLSATYDDPDVKKVLPFAETLREAVAQGKPRPVSPVYSQVSEAISTNVYAALQGRTSAEDALKTMSEDISKALETF